MPKLSRCFVRGGILSLAIGLIPGGLILIQKGTGWFPAFWVLLPAHTYLVLIGGMGQFTLGMCYWVLPRLDGGARGHTALAWSSYFLLNSALALIIVHPLLEVWGGTMAATLAFTSAGILQSAAALTFVLHIWPRIRPATTPVPRRLS